MAWTAPMTAVATQIFTATQFNTNIRDNLLETAPAAAVSGQFFVAGGANTVEGHTPGLGNDVATSQTTTSTSYVDLATVGPTATQDVTERALVILSAAISNNTLDTASYASFDMSGANTASANDQWALVNDGVATNGVLRSMTAHLFTGLSRGQTTWTAKYRVSAGTGTFADRHMIVIPF